MVEYCVDKQIPLGLALPKVESEQNLKLAGRDNVVYEPESIFGVGPVTIVKSMDDGRMLVAISVNQRVEIGHQLQSVPYLMYRAVKKPSRVENKILADFTFDRLRKLSRDILGDKYVHFEKRVAESIWESQDLTALMIRIMEWFRLDSKELQRLLNEPIIENRASRYADVMEFYLRQLSQEDTPSQPDEPQAKVTPREPIHEPESDNETEDNVIQVNFGKAR